MKSRKRAHRENGEETQPGDERDADFSVLEGGSAAPLEGESPAAEGAEDGSYAAPVQAELDALSAELQDAKDKYLRALAETENVRKRALKERSDLLKYQGEQLIIDLLEVVDSFERALEYADADPKQFVEGVRLIHKQFAEVLGRWDVRASSAMGKQFDPNVSRAIGKAPVPNAEPNTVIGELKKAYFYKDRLIRPGEVMVAEAPPAAPDDGDSAEEGAEASPESDSNEP